MKFDDEPHITALLCRSPHGERGLKYLQDSETRIEFRRSPHGERGLKSKFLGGAAFDELSLSPRGAWIEIDYTHIDRFAVPVAPPARSVD